MKDKRTRVTTSSRRNKKELPRSSRSIASADMHENNKRENKSSSWSIVSSPYDSFDSTEGAWCNIFGVGSSSSDVESEFQNSVRIKSNELSASRSLESKEKDFNKETIGITQSHTTEQVSIFTRLKRGIAKLICHEEDEFSLTEIDDLDAEILWTSSRALDIPRTISCPAISEPTEPNVSSENNIFKEENVSAEASTSIEHTKDINHHIEDKGTQTQISSERPSLQMVHGDIRNETIPPSLTPPPPPPPPPREKQNKSGQKKSGQKKVVDETSFTDSNVDNYKKESGYISPDSSFEEEEIIDSYLSFLSPSNCDKKDSVSVSQNELGVEPDTSEIATTKKKNRNSNNLDLSPNVEESELNSSVTANVGSPNVHFLDDQMQMSEVLDSDFRDILIQQEWSNIPKSNKKFISPSNSEEENEEATELSTLPDSVGSRSTFPTTLNHNEVSSTMPRDHHVDLRDIFIQQEGLYECSSNVYLSSDDYDENEDIVLSTVDHVEENHSESKSTSNDDTFTIRESTSENDSIPDDIMDKVLSALDNKATTTTTTQKSSIDPDGTFQNYDFDDDDDEFMREMNRHNTATFAKTAELISAAKDLIHKTKVTNTSMHCAKIQTQYEQDSRDDVSAEQSPKQDRMSPDTSPSWVDKNGNDRLREKIQRRNAQLDKIRHQLSQARRWNSSTAMAQ